MYRFDEATKLCVKFVYPGSGGTDNRFKTLRECVNTCGAENSLEPPRMFCDVKQLHFKANINL